VLLSYLLWGRALSRQAVENLRRTKGEASPATRCLFCDGDVPTAAAVCPHCNRLLRYRGGRAWETGLAFVVVLACLLYFLIPHWLESKRQEGMPMRVIKVYLVDDVNAKPKKSDDKLDW
jgi:predicted nucleic acid-binding Zn ribbon protein